MASKEIIIPSMGEGITDVTIIKWLKREGEFVQEDDTIAEIATDKVDSEISAPISGKIITFFVKEGDIVKIGESIALISDEEDYIIDENIKPKKIIIESNKSQNEERIISNNNLLQNRTVLQYHEGMFLSPLVKNIITKEKITKEELSNITGSGIGKRITKDDIINYIQNKNKSEKTTRETSEYQIAEKSQLESLSDYPINTESEEFEIIPMGRVRKLIAEHMNNSLKTSAHVTSFIEADATKIVMWREKNKNDFQNSYNEKLTYTPIFLEAIINTIKEYPLINVSVENTNIIRKKFINIGMATALNDGNLIVPVIKQACQKNLVGLVKSVNDLAKRARENKLLPEEIHGGTFTVTNLGSFDILTGTPIINQPEVAILGIGIIKKRPVVIETQTGDTIGIKHMVILSLSFDHRVIDGALSGMFLKRVSEHIVNFDFSRNI
ncbi:MAG: dihydrolipoamide acetyltransferase family protein [Bacteroidota bacterium]